MEATASHGRWLPSITQVGGVSVQPVVGGREPREIEPVEERQAGQRVGTSGLRFLRQPGFWFIAPAIAFLGVLVVFPMVFLFRTTLYDLTFLNFRAGAPFIGLENYAELLTDRRLPIAIRNTFLFVFVGVGVQFVLGLSMALVFNKVLKSNFVLSLLMIPTMMTPLIIGLLWRYILNSDFGIISQLLMMAGGGRQAWLAEPGINVLVLMIIDAWQWTPFMFLILLAGLQTMPTQVFEAAQLDGASGLKMLVFVILPVIKPVVLVALLFRVMDAFKVFDIVAVLTGGGPGSSSYTLTLKAMIDGFTHFRLGYAGTVSVLTLALAVVFSLVLLRVVYREMGKEEE
jgi:multiple sugar transport system permease protein